MQILQMLQSIRLPSSLASVFPPEIRGRNRDLDSDRLAVRTTAGFARLRMKAEQEEIAAKGGLENAGSCSGDATSLVAPQNGDAARRRLM
jgi:hypothetical protein